MAKFHIRKISRKYVDTWILVSIKRTTWLNYRMEDEIERVLQQKRFGIKLK